MSNNLRDVLLVIPGMTGVNAMFIADTIREVIDKRIEAAKPQPAEPRQNPYADWETYDDYRELFTAQEMREGRWEAWNEGAQSAGSRDE